MTDARDEAIRDAMRRAAEKHVGVHLESRTLVENGELISDEIEARVNAFVKDRVPVRQWRDGNVLHVEIVAEVLTGPAMERELLTVARRTNNVVILVEEDNIEKRMTESYVAHEVASRFVQIGYRVLDPERLEALHQKNPVLFGSARGEGLAARRRLAARFLANVLVTGTASSWNTTPDLSGYDVAKANMPAFAKARASLRVLLADTAEVVCDKDVEVPRAAHGHEIVDAGRDALKRVAQLVGEALVEGGCIPGRLRQIRVEVAGVPSYREYQRLEAFLRATRHTRSVEAGGFDPQTRSVFMVTNEEEARFLASRIDGDPRYRVIEQTENRIIVAYEEAAPTGEPRGDRS